MATKPQIEKQDDINKPNNEFCGTGYGFQFHICKDNYYRLDGAFGQLCLICPNKNISVTIFSQNSKMEDLLSLIYKHLLDTDCLGYPITDNAANYIFETNNNIEIPSSKYTICENALKIETLEFLQEKDSFQLLINYREYTNNINYSFSHMTEGELIFIKDLQNHRQKYICTASSPKNTLILKLYLIETPYIVTYEFDFSPGGLKFDFSINVSFTLKNQTMIGSLYDG